VKIWSLIRDESGMQQRIAIAAVIAAIGTIAAVVRPGQSHAPAIEAHAEPVPSARPLAAATHAPAGAVVYVVGEVRRPGVYTLSDGARVDAALSAAGGPTQTADLVAVNLAERISDGERIVVEAKGAHIVPATRRRERSATIDRAGRAGSSHARRRAKHPPPGETIDLNTAGESELTELPGIGPSLAERIIAYRELNGRFSSLEDVLDVGGMTDRRLEQISPYAVVR